MDSLLERYLCAVCSHFMGPKRNQVYNDLKNNIDSNLVNYDRLEDLLINYGHPISVAYSYGYKPLITHIYNKKTINKLEKGLAIVLSIYLFFSTLYYLQQFDCLPFFHTHRVISSINSSTLLTWCLSHPIYIIVGIICIGLIYLFIADKSKPVSQDRDLSWNMAKLNQLPCAQRYSNHTIISYIMIVFVAYFIIYTFVFSTPQIIKIQNTTYQMIHLMIYFFQPFILMILFDYCIDMTKKVYTKRYLTYSTFINLFIFISLSIFIVNSSFLDNYLLPFTLNFRYDAINILIIIGIILIYSITSYKLYRDFITYRALFKNNKTLTKS